MKIAIIGLGFVGLSFAAVLGSKGYRVVGVDVDKEKVEKIRSGILPFHEPDLDTILKKALGKGLYVTSSMNDIVDKCKLIFITVGTPQRNDGSIDLTTIKSVTKKIGKLVAKSKNAPTIIIKSTVIPETTNKIIEPILEKESRKKSGIGFGIVTNPEFLRETNAVNDTINPHVVLIGGYHDKFMRDVEKFYKLFHKNVPIINTNHQTAEMIKYANNSFLATKISFINQLATICETIPGANVDVVAKTIGLDPRIGNQFLVAGPGYGGSCLPKDIKAIINFSEEHNVKPTLFNAVEEVNLQQLKKIISAIKKKIGTLKNKKITVLGLAFKPNTDDIRDSISIKLIDLLLKEGSNVSVHDPKALDNTSLIFGNRIEYHNSVKNALKGSHCAIIMTAWRQYQNITQAEMNSMKRMFIVDTRRLLINKKFDADYIAVGVG